MYVLRKPEERWNTQCLGLYGSRNGGARVSVMFWGVAAKMELVQSQMQKEILTQPIT